MKKVSDLTRNQHANLWEWFRRMRETFSMHDAIVIFNGLDPVAQQKIYGRLWFSRSTGNPIKRDLLEKGQDPAALIEKGFASLSPKQKKQYLDYLQSTSRVKKGERK